MTEGLSGSPHCFRSQTASRDSGITQRCGSKARWLHPWEVGGSVGKISLSHLPEATTGTDSLALERQRDPYSSSSPVSPLTSLRGRAHKSPPRETLVWCCPLVEGTADVSCGHKQGAHQPSELAPSPLSAGSPRLTSEELHIPQKECAV